LLQQVVELEGASAAAGVVRRLLEGYMQLQQDSSTQEDVCVTALTHLAQVLLLVWRHSRLGACGEVVQQRVTLVTSLQTAVMRVGAARKMMTHRPCSRTSGRS
jgi:hypothetical protein